MATNFYPATKVSVLGPLNISDKRSADMPLDIRGRIETLTDITTIPFAWEGMLVYVRDTKKYYKVTSLANRTVSGVTIPYYPATWVEFGSGGSTPSPTPYDIDAGDVTYSSGGTFIDGTVGKELQSLANDIFGLTEDIHNLSSDIGGKVAGIKVQGESSVLPMDGNGIVTIPAGGEGGTGTITGATVGGNPVTASGGILQFDAYPTANTMQYSSSTNYNSGTIGKEVKDLNKDVNDLSTKVAELDKPSSTPSPSTTVVNLAEYATSSSSFTYDVDNKYIYNTKDTTFYQYSEEDNSNTVYYGVFKVIGEDRYLMYSITNNTTFTYVNTYTELTLPENAKKEFALGSVAVVKRVNGEGESWKNGTVNLFCTKQNMPLRNRCKNINFNGSTAWRVLIKSEDGNTIFVYKAKSNGNYEWEINVPRSSTANFNLLDKYFDRPEASNVSFDDTIPQLGTENDPVTNIQDAINQLATGIRGFTGKLIIRLLYANSSPIANKEVSITVNWRGESYDISSMYSPDTQGFKTNSDGYVIDAANHEFLVLPLGATYTIHFYDISINYITPEDKTGIIDANSKTINCVYDNASDNEMVYVFVQMPNVPPSVATTNNKILYVYYYDNNDVSYLQYKCLLRENGTIKKILNSDGKQATFNGNNLISDSDPVLIPVPIGNKYTCALQEWDETIPSTQQEYVKSPNQTFIASKIKRSITFKYINVQLGIFLVVADSTKSIGYRECIVTDQDTVNNRITFKDGESTYYAYLNNSSLYKDLVGSNTPILWEENIIGYGVRTSILVSTDNNDDDTYSTYPNCCFFVPKDIQFQTGQMLSSDVNVTLDSNDKGGLFLTKALAGLSNDQMSPICQALINNNSKAITLNIPNQNTRIIQGFVPTRFQIDALRSNYNIINTIHNILTGSRYYKNTGTTTNRIWSSSLDNNTSHSFYIFENNSSFSTTNPSIFAGTGTSFAAFVFYPF